MQSAIEQIPSCLLCSVFLSVINATRSAEPSASDVCRGFNIYYISYSPLSVSDIWRFGRLGLH